MMSAMKRSIIFLATILVSALSHYAQQLPAPIRADLNSRFPAAEGSWRAAAGACAPKGWVLTGDFNGDARTDYALRVTAGKAPSVRIVLIVFVAKARGFDSLPVAVEPYDDTFRNSSFEIVRKGKSVNLGLGAEGEGPSIRLENDGVAQFICGTDGIRTFIFRDGKMIDVRDLGESGKLSGKYPYPVLVAEPVPNLSGNWRAFGADGKPAAGVIRFRQTGPKVTLEYPDGYKYPARIRNGSFILDLGGTGTIENRAALILFRNGTYFLREGGSAVIGESNGIPRIEQDCLDRVRAAGLNLRPTGSGLAVDRSLELLCAATENPPATLDCFRSNLASSDIEIASGRCSAFGPIFEEGKEFFRNNNRARLAADGLDPDSPLAFTRLPEFAGARAPSVSPGGRVDTTVTGDAQTAPSIEVVRLAGRWSVFGPNNAQIPLTEATLSVDGKIIRLEVKSENYTRRATARLEQPRIVTGWNTTGTVSPDHRRINWSDGTHWRKDR